MNKITRRHFIRYTGLGLSAAALSRCASDNSGLHRDIFSNRPNLIVLVTDDQRWDALGCAGNPFIQTPNMDMLAERGVRFENAFTTTPICAASRASLLTGLYERTHGYTFTKPPLYRKYCDISYPMLLRRAGYRTGFVGKFGIAAPKGAEKEMFDVFQPSRYPYFIKVNGEEKHLTDIHVDHAIDFLRGACSNQPFCLSLSFWAPHADDGNPEQYIWPHACDGLYKGINLPPPMASDPVFFEGQPKFLKGSLNRERWHWRFDTPEKYQKMVKGYFRMISGVDRALGRLMDELNRLGMAQNTVIILLSDNGYFLGERGFAGKWTMHEPSIRIPLIIYDPRKQVIEPGSVSKEMVLNVDVAPTILELANLPVPEVMQGRSMLPLLKGDAAGWRREIFSEHLWDHPKIPQTEALRTESWKYIRYPRHSEFEELYDLMSDPNEEVNQAVDPRRGEMLENMRRRCDHFIEKLSKSGI